MMASPPIDTAVDCPSPAAVSVDDISVVMPPEREIIPTGPGCTLAASLAGPPMPPILITSGTITRQFGPMMRALRVPASSTIWAIAARDALGHDHDQLDPVLDRLEHGVLGEGGGTVTTDPLIGPPWCSTAWATVSNTGTPWTSRPSRPGVTPPTIFAPAP